ncbi:MULTISPECIES: helix-turn-helix domain-containing protein [Actinomadura]|uniref:Scr1 family TA system antitoxin-like transcriptional regulator n=1 Tax=Actinomadura yumaensis TaxID=111807 RepID=A0ABW2CUI9_9ACTN|nr:helix-turn-helix transcriptional regulator [Actinomadura sp. J1-007]
MVLGIPVIKRDHEMTSVPRPRTLHQSSYDQYRDAPRQLDPARSLWDLIAVELRRQIYVQSASQARVAEILECTRSYVSRLVNGTRHLSPAHAGRLDTAWKLRGLFAHLVAHAHARPDDDWLPSLAAYEARATRIRTWDVSVIPGLWQTPDYARATFERAYAAGLISDVDSALAARLERQEAVWDRADPPRMSAILSWAVLETPAGGAEVMRGQLAHLLALAERPGVSVRVVGKHQGWHVGLDGACQLLTVGGDVAFAEAPGMGRVVLDSERVERYARRIESVGDLAWTTADSRTAITKAMGTSE